MVQPHSPTPSDPPERGARLSYRIEDFSDDWIIPEEIPAPESAWHDGCLELFKALLVAWAERTAQDAAVFRDMAIRPKQGKPRVGFNPDVCLVSPAPPGAHELESLRLWEAPTPRLAFEAVSPSHPYKDYVIVPEKCAVTGVEELIVFDPLLAGPRAGGGPWLLQVWQRPPEGGLERVYAGGGAARSAVLGAWLVPDGAEHRLRVAARSDGGEPWLTKEERAVEAEARALARVRELEAELARSRR